MSSVTYPENWKGVTIENISSFVGRGIGPNYSDIETDVIAINQKCIRNGKVNIDFGRYHDNASLVRQSAILNTNDICINSTGDGTIGRVGLWDKPNSTSSFFVDSHVTIVRPISEERDSKYLSELLSSEWIQNDIARYCFTGSTNQVELSRTELLQLTLYFPELKQQQKIAEILSTVDNLIDQTQSLIDKYTAVKLGMMADLSSRGIDISGTPETNKSYGQLRPSYEDAPELYQETELGFIPKDWHAEPLQEFLSLITYGFTNPMPETEDGPWMVTAANVIDGEIDYKNTRHTSLEAFNTLLTQKSKPKLNDILLTKDGTLGRLALVDDETVCINQSVALLRCNEKVKPHFMKLLLETEKYYHKMLDDAGGSTIKHIYITIVDKMLIGLPPNPKEQDAIYSKAAAIIEKINTEKTYLEKLKLKKKGLMQDLLTGKVKVS
ncbi:MAG: hypothetical protein CL679_11675 [Bermanella sp.]|uniref:restriction endonuclease subunit S n=1 Tax=uncultured Pseudoalteromonas sp. TaxID=114053 RepID=UPI000C92CE49|nr:restriction endonuclease subunit S [uncultured Pseudoalteromonas sp.]MAA72369.1 hypothetical protein [Bermanella sp.]|tara:strand:+ start:6992 stop:8308 length:1317 start_codon:yes stop_codon:yes gene_type:complete